MSLLGLSAGSAESTSKFQQASSCSSCRVGDAHKPLERIQQQVTEPAPVSWLVRTVSDARRAASCGSVSSCWLHQLRRPRKAPCLRACVLPQASHPWGAVRVHLPHDGGPYLGAELHARSLRSLPAGV